tara:strand:- start:1401 stop:1778 length:378 start_codon:yes stop_codon:yes gene_type:complete
VLTKPAADTPSTEKLKLICTNPIALAAETPDGERIEFVINVGSPIALAAETPEGLKDTGTVTVSSPIALAAETPVTLKDTGRLTVSSPIALAAETPVTTTGSGLFQDPEFQVLLSQPVIKDIRQS